MAQLTNFWRNLRRRDLVEGDLDDELRATLDLLIEEKVRAGMSPDDARRAARVELGAVEAIKDNVRDARAGAVLGHVVRDVRYAARALMKSRGFAVIIVTTLALGSAGVTTMFALVNAILIQPLPYPGSDRLVAIKHAAPGLGLAEAGLSSGTYFHYRAHARSVEALAVYDETVLNLSTPGMGTERVEVTYAGPELFDVLGVRPVFGRLFTTEDGRPGFMNMTWPVPVLLSHELWIGRYGGDPAIIGGSITLNNRARHVVGVLPADFDFPRRETQIWMLFMPAEQRASFASDFEYQAVARLRPGVSAAAAATELAQILPSIEGVYRDATAERLAEVRLTPIVVPLKDDIVGDVSTLLWLLFGGMTFLTLMACANVATLSLLRAEHRDREVAVRAALGARRIDLLRLFVSEAGLLSLAGAALGLLLARLALQAIVVFTPIRLPRLAEVQLDVWVFAFACGLAALAALLVGGLTFLRQTVASATAAALKMSGRITGNRGSRRTRNSLVAVQVALALTLLVGSALMAQSFWRLMRVDPGFDSADVLTIEIGLPGSMASRHQRVYGGVLEQVRALPGVRSAAAVSSLPLDGTPDAYPMRLGARSRPTEEPVTMKFVMPGYFQTMRMPVVEGASFAPGEHTEPNAVVVSAALARRFFPGDSAIGKPVLRLASDGQAVEMLDGPVPPWTIVGIVADVREESLRAEPAEIVYVPVREPPVERSIVPTSMTLVIRAGAPSASLITTARNTIRAFEPALSVARIRTMDEIVARSTASERFLAALLLGAAAAALFLGTIGVYGVAAHAVRRREREIGIRVSLGATPRQLVRMVLAQSAVLVVIGSTLGLVLAFIATRALRSFLFDVSATDPASVGIATVLLMLSALVANALPARRAVRLDPVAALRSE